MSGSPTVRRRRLAAALRRLRDQSGLTADEAARRVGISKSALSRVENALVSVMPPVARALLELYGVSPTEIEPLLQIAREARKRGWWQRYGDVLPDWFETYVGLEAEAAEIRTYEPQLVPGLLQTEEYARAVIRAEHPDAPQGEVDRRVELRIRRQNVDSPPRLWMVLDEAVLRRPVGGPEVMSRQLDKIRDIGSRPGVTIQVLPFMAGEHGSMGSAFSILTFQEPTDPGVVYIETRAGSLYLEDQEEREYTALFNHLVAQALSHRDSATMLRVTAAHGKEGGSE